MGPCTVKGDIFQRSILNLSPSFIKKVFIWVDGCRNTASMWVDRYSGIQLLNELTDVHVGIQLLCELTDVGTQNLFELTDVAIQLHRSWQLHGPTVQFRETFSNGLHWTNPFLKSMFFYPKSFYMSDDVRRKLLYELTYVVKKLLYELTCSNTASLCVDVYSFYLSWQM